MAITLTQDSYRLWARIGYVAGVTPTDASVIAQLAWLDAESVLNEKP
jgi:hypothetical protein